MQTLKLVCSWIAELCMERCQSTCNIFTRQKIIPRIFLASVDYNNGILNEDELCSP
jgi:hypothetical protein